MLCTACGARESPEAAGLEETSLPAPRTAPRGASGAAQAAPAGAALAAVNPQPAAADLAAAAGVAPVWLPLAQRLAADGLSGPRVTALLQSLGPTASQSPMGRKMRELYQRRFFPKPPAPKPAQQYYKGVVTTANARLCRAFVAEHQADFAMAETRYGVPPSVAVALLFVETRLGKVLADVPENAFHTLASMAVSRSPQDIADWLPRMPGYEAHLDWFAETMPKRADWAYKETRALVEHMLRDNVPPEHLPGSIYGAVGLCQFMPSNIAVYGADGNGDGRVDLFDTPDAIASLANYLARHGWKPGLPRTRQHKILMAYNHSVVYANTILALADLVEKQ
ncbi:lytic murein transglycosylase [Desulfovibrio legallii]|uniref:lytic murein transglycosylase n=1 Tax=Desulfovibrio legallii TaxID=571438 RepID=UPI0021479ABB|nr:lytic murein transglycosylase [Desulfovibrio legallii]